MNALSKFSRRDFLKLAAVGVGGGAACYLFGSVAFGHQEALARFAGRLLRGTSDGQVLFSLDEGENWQTLADFGPAIEFLQFVHNDASLLARVAFQGHVFWLRSEDGARWVNYA